MSRFIRQIILCSAALSALSSGVCGQEAGPDLSHQLRTVGEALAAAQQDAAQQKEEAERLRLQIEALGVSAVSDSERAVQLRLISAVRDLRVLEEEKTVLAERLARLSEAALAHTAGATEATTTNLNQEIAEASRALGNARTVAAPAVSIDNATVVSVKRDLGLAVINAGRDGGVRMGMPLRLMRGDSSVASGIVIDLRDRIAGVLLTDSGGTGGAVGDSVRPEVTNSKQ